MDIACAIPTRCRNLKKLRIKTLRLSTASAFDRGGNSSRAIARRYLLNPGHKKQKPFHTHFWIQWRVFRQIADALSAGRRVFVNIKAGDAGVPLNAGNIPTKSAWSWFCQRRLVQNPRISPDSTRRTRPRSLWSNRKFCLSVLLQSFVRSHAILDFRF